MFHFVARSLGRRLLFRTWSEGLALWRGLASLPGLIALVAMPDHTHGLLRVDRTREWRRLHGEHARWLNHRRGWKGRLWEPIPSGEPVHHGKIARVERYIHLNPCRFPFLRPDPAGWPLSSYRDALGLVRAPMRARAEDAIEFHRFTSSDPTVDVGGTSLPVPNLLAPTPRQVEAAASAVCRVTRAELRKRGAPRRLLIRSLLELAEMDVPAIARFVGVHRRTVERTPRSYDRDVALVARVAGDIRFGLLHEGDLLRLPEFRYYRERGFV